MFEERPAVPRSSVAAFEKYHEENPHVYDLFEQFTFDAIEAGRKRFSARTVIHRMRWFTTVETVGEDLKINNNWTPYYVRMFESLHPEHEGFFSKRRAIADE